MSTPRTGRRSRAVGERNRPAAWILVVLTPLISELALGSTPIRMAWLVLLWVPIYGAGVLLIRELVTRSGRGWASVLLLALAYELLEDGLGLQALTSPNLYHAAQWGARVAGINLPYWEANAIYHAVFTVVIPIAVTDLLFPRHKGKPYLGWTGLTFSAVVAVLGVAVLRVTVPLTQDPGYQAPLPFVVGCIVAVVVLGVVALRVLPRRTTHVHGGAVPRPWVLGLGSAVATLAFFALSFPMLGARQPAFTHGWLVLIPMLVTAVGAYACFRLLSWTSSSRNWTERHTLASIGGALVAHSLGGLVAVARTPVDRIGLLAIVLVTVAALAWLDRRLRVRSALRMGR